MTDTKVTDVTKTYADTTYTYTETITPIDTMVGRYCMVRTFSAGVFAGTIQSRNGKEAVLTNARRIYYWSGASTLSELATRGTSAPDKCKFPCEVGEVLLTEVIEIIPMTDQAIASLVEVAIWST